MQKSVSALTYPRLHEYLSHLPVGLMSFADHQARAEQMLHLRHDYPQIAQIDDLPHNILRMLTQPLSPNAWVPEVFLQVLILIVRDRFVESDEMYLAHVRSRVRKLLEHPLLRHLKFIWSPKLMILGVRYRYNKFHTGSIWELKQGDVTKHEGEMRFPPHLLCTLFLRDVAIACEESVAITGAKNVKSYVTLKEPGVARFITSWQN